MKESLRRYRQLTGCLTEPLRTALSAHEASLSDKITEIRLRADRPVSVQTPTERYYLTASGNLTAFYSHSLWTTDVHMLDEVVRKICEYSVYSRQNEIVNGFITLRGGHRAGICGTAVLRDGEMSNVRCISSVNLRFAREIRGSADQLLHSVKDISGGVLICGEPSSGKTTLLRDLARQLSADRNVALIDERGELAACIGGMPQNDVGLCDVYDGYPKAEAMRHAVRTMSPDVLICDEIGTDEEASLRNCLRGGVAVIATAHIRHREELRRHPAFRTGAFSTVVFLSGRQNVGEIISVQSVGDVLAA